MRVCILSQCGGRSVRGNDQRLGMWLEVFTCEKNVMERASETEVGGPFCEWAKKLFIDEFCI